MKVRVNGKSETYLVVFAKSADTGRIKFTQPSKSQRDHLVPVFTDSLKFY